MQNFHTGAKNRELFFAGICTVCDTTTLSDHKCRKKSQKIAVKKVKILVPAQTIELSVKQLSTF
jgi:hypothetical protein